MVAEWCSLEDSAFPGRKAQWLTDAATSLKTMRAIKMVCYFDSPLVFPWGVDPSRSSLRTFAAMGRTPIYGPSSESRRLSKTDRNSKCTDYLRAIPRSKT